MGGAVEAPEEVGEGRIGVMGHDFTPSAHEHTSRGTGVAWVGH